MGETRETLKHSGLDDRSHTLGRQNLCGGNSTASYHQIKSAIFMHGSVLLAVSELDPNTNVVTCVGKCPLTAVADLTVPAI